MADMQLRLISAQISGLDMILGGGSPMGSLIMLVGAPGAGKTNLLQQLAFAWVKSQSTEFTHWYVV
jgi:KaiC/GvpD/RAD55 family RecA-like ATPase